MRIKSQERYIKKFLRVVPLNQLSKVQMKLSRDPNSLANHGRENLLNGFKTKFIASDLSMKKGEEFYISFTFTTPQQISAFGLRSANNYPHLDPSHFRIEVLLDEHQPYTKKEKSNDLERSFIDRYFRSSN